MEYCRLCAKSDRKVFPILENNPLNVKEKLEKLLHIVVSETNKLPKMICLECLKKLNQFNEFFTTSQENQVVLEFIFGEASVPSERPEDPPLNRPGEQQTSKELPREIFIIEEFTSDTQESHQDENLVTFEPVQEIPLKREEKPKAPSSSKKRKIDRFDCCVCEEQLTSNVSLVQHFIESHPSEELRYTCFMCPNSVKKYRSYIRHLETHTGRGFACDICNKSFSQKITLVQHLNTHSTVKTYKCEECGLEFKQNSSLFKHRKQKHFNKTPTCSECQKSFVNNETLQQHLRSKHNAPKDIQCPDCDKTFASRSALTYHRSAQHQNSHESEKMLCKICNKTFKTAFTLSRHLKNLHIQRLAPEPSFETKIQNLDS